MSPATEDLAASATPSKKPHNVRAIPLRNPQSHYSHLYNPTYLYKGELWDVGFVFCGIPPHKKNGIVGLWDWARIHTFLVSSTSGNSDPSGR